MNLSENIADIDLLIVMEAEGIELRRLGNGFKFRCPFHDDRNPSGSLRNNGKWRWHCFGCQVGGDVIDVIMKRHGLDFRGACRYLGMESGKLSPADQARIKKNKARRKITETFKAWGLSAIVELRDTISTAYQISSRWQTIEDFERGAMILDCLGDLQGQLNVLMMGSLADRRGVYRRWKERGGFF